MKQIYKNTENASWNLERYKYARIKLLWFLFFISFSLSENSFAQVNPKQISLSHIAPVPIFRDPITDGAADPIMIWNRLENSSKASAIGDPKWQRDTDQFKWPAYNIYLPSTCNYGFELNSALSERFENIKRPWPESNFPFTQKDVPIMIKAKGILIPEWTLDKYGLCGALPQSPVDVDTQEQNIELVTDGSSANNNFCVSRRGIK